MAQSAKTKSNIADPGPDVSPFATTDFELCPVCFGRQEPGLEDLDRPGFQGYLLTVPGQVIGAFACHLDGRISRRDLIQDAREAGQDRLDVRSRRALVSRAGDR